MYKFLVGITQEEFECRVIIGGNSVKRTPGPFDARESSCDSGGRSPKNKNEKKQKLPTVLIDSDNSLSSVTSCIFSFSDESEKSFAR